MINRIKFILVSAGAGLHIGCAFAQMPSAEALAAETKKQLGIANQAINKASNQASFPAPSPPLLVPAPANLKSVDPSEIAQRYKEFSKPAAPELYVMVSFSMPDASLDRLAELSARAGATLVLMGLHKDSLPQTIERLSMITKKYATLKVTIDPPLFLKFSVKAVPTFVLAKAPIDQSACTSACRPEDQFTSLAGDVTLDYALDYMASKADSGTAFQAKAYLAKLGRVQ